jgi:hypothetical protein
MGGFFTGQFDQKRLLSSLSPLPMSPVAAGDKSFFSPRDTIKAIAGMKDNGGAATPAQAGSAQRVAQDQTDYAGPSSTLMAAPVDLEEKKRASTTLLGK